MLKTMPPSLRYAARVVIRPTTHNDHLYLTKLCLKHCRLFFPDTVYMIIDQDSSSSQTDRRKDGRTTCLGSTALRQASRGKNTIRIHACSMVNYFSGKLVKLPNWCHQISDLRPKCTKLNFRWSSAALFETQVEELTQLIQCFPRTSSCIQGPTSKEGGKAGRRRKGKGEKEERSERRGRMKGKEGGRGR